MLVSVLNICDTCGWVPLFLFCHLPQASFEAMSPRGSVAARAAHPKLPVPKIGSFPKLGKVPGTTAAEGNAGSAEPGGDTGAKPTSNSVATSELAAQSAGPTQKRRKAQPLPPNLPTNRFYGLPPKARVIDANGGKKAHKSKYGPNAVDERGVSWCLCFGEHVLRPHHRRPYICFLKIRLLFS